MERNKVIFAAFAVFAVVCVAIIIGLNAKLNRLSAQKEKEFEAKLSREKDIVRKGLEEKHQADTVSYMAMVKRLELEKQKSQSLEEQLKGGAAKTAPAKK
jgi:hypothetical protein